MTPFWGARATLKNPLSLFPFFSPPFSAQTFPVSVSLLLPSLSSLSLFFLFALPLLLWAFSLLSYLTEFVLCGLCLLFFWWWWVRSELGTKNKKKEKQRKTKKKKTLEFFKGEKRGVMYSLFNLLFSPFSFSIYPTSF